ncbi:MAG: ABC transporter ATP-binding protein [Candidatus Geothermarchaeales archaeon]
MVSDRVIEAHGLYKIYNKGFYNEVTALRGIDLHVDRGEFLLISGRSGSGKTTLLNLIGCLDRPTSGTIKLLRKDITNLGDEELARIRLREIGFIFQSWNLFPTLTVFENIELPLTLAGVPKKQRHSRVQELLRTFGLVDLSTRFPDMLSSGEQQRIAAIRALGNRPGIILADEPTSNLDEENSILLLDVLKTINEKYKVTMILVSNYPHPAGGYCSRHLELKEGRLYGK